MPTKSATKTQNQPTLALDVTEQVKESLEQALEQGPAYEATNYASTANGNKIIKLPNGNYQEIDSNDNLVGQEYPEAMFQWALQSGFLVEASLLKGTAKIAEKPKHQYKLSFIESIDLTFDESLSTELIESLEQCNDWPSAKSLLEGLEYQTDMLAVKAQLTKLGAKKGRASNGESNPMTQLKKLKVVQNYLPKALSDYPELFNELKSGMPMEKFKSLKQEMIGKGKGYWKDVPSYLQYANLGDDPLGYAKDISTGMLTVDRVPTKEDLMSYARHCNE